MIDAIAAAARGLQTEERRFNGAARDVANANTPGYKAAGGGWSQGALLPTGSPLDLGIAGGGYFRVTRGDGSVAYTRNGSFRLDAQGRLVTGSGERVDPEIAVPPGTDDVRIGPHGDVSAAVGGALVPLGRIELAGFSNPDGLVSAGDGLLEETAASGPAGPADGFIVQGGLEASGTDHADAAVTQITASRSYTALACVFRTADEMQGSLLDMLA
jgi:flagellar basal-body rod protein FlgG